MAILLVFFGALSCAFSNLFLRRSIDAGGTSKTAIIIQQALSIVVAVILGPLRAHQYAWDDSVALIGCIAGIFLGLMMWALGKAFENGPAGLTVAILNASSLLPAIVMAWLFGHAFGYQYLWHNGVGSVLVLCGLYWAAHQHSIKIGNKALSWLVFVFVAFFLHVLFLIMIEWQSLLLTLSLPTSKLLPFSIEDNHAQWFMPMISLSSTIVLVICFWKKEKRTPHLLEYVYGLCGGICYGLSNFYLLQAIAAASPIENPMLFPLFSVILVIACNIWGRLLYNEQVNWKANALCLFGLFIGIMR